MFVEAAIRQKCCFNECDLLICGSGIFALRSFMWNSWAWFLLPQCSHFPAEKTEAERLFPCFLPAVDEAGFEHRSPTPMPISQSTAAILCLSLWTFTSAFTVVTWPLNPLNETENSEKPFSHRRVSTRENKTPEEILEFCSLRNETKHKKLFISWWWEWQETAPFLTLSMPHIQCATCFLQRRAGDLGVECWVAPLDPFPLFPELCLIRKPWG